MEADPLSPHIATASARRELLSLLVSSGAYSQDRHFVNIDRIWQSPPVLDSFSLHLCSLLPALLPIAQTESLATVDNVDFPYGPVPIAVEVSRRLGLPLAIWKENADPVTASHEIFGHLPSSKTIMLYDVTRFGLTALRSILWMHERDYAPRWFVTIVDCEEDAREIITGQLRADTGLVIDFIPIFTLGEIAAEASRAGANP